MSVLRLFVLLFLTVLETRSGRILAYYPCPSISHQVVFRPITLELIKRGHEVTVITADPMFQGTKSPAKLTEIDVHDVSYNIMKTHFPDAVTGKRADLLNQVKVIVEISSMLIEEQFKLREVKELFRRRDDEFDLLMLEAYFTPALALTHKFSAPAILVSSFGAFPGNFETVGGPTHPVVYHDFFRQRLYNLTLWEKVNELVNQYRIKKLISDAEERENVLLQKIFGPDIPSLRDLKNNVDMLFLNINPIWEGNFPVPPGVIHMGGLHQKPPQELPKDLKTYLDEAKNGVIYFSLGTNVKPSLLPLEKIAIFERVFSQLPYDVIWKWDNNEFVTKSSNIKIYQWLPQSDLLRHPNIKLFITQGGLQSTDEAITAGVPLIGIPMLGDQWYNVEKYVHHEIGVRLDLENLTEDKLEAAIIEVVEEKSYRSNIARLRSLMEDQPQSPLERAIWWIEYVIRHGGAKHLRAPAANMSWMEFLELELVGLVILGVFITVTLTIVAVRFLVTRIRPKKVLDNKIKFNWRKRKARRVIQDLHAY